MKTILVTGSEGNIGSYIVRRLVEKYPEAKIIRVGRKPRQAENYYSGDLRDPAFVKKLFAGNRIDCVVHAAAENYSAALLKSNPFGMLANDTACTLNLLNASVGIKKFVFLSSSSIYESVDKFPFAEVPVADLSMPKSPIGIAKFFGEQATEMFAAQFGIRYTIWRAFNVVSPLEPHNTSGGHVFVDYYRKIFVERQPKIEVFGSGSQIRCFTWVEDAAAGIADFLQAPKTDNQTFNIGSTRQTTLLDLLKLMISMGKEKNLLPADYEPEIITGREFYGVDSRARIPDVSKLEQVLGFRAATDFEDCFEKFIEAKRERL